MKTFFNSGRIPVLIVMVLLLGLTTCKKEDKDKFFRVKSVNDYFNGVFNGGTQIIYDGERVWEMSSNDLDGDSSRSEYSYPEANKALESYYEYNGFSWNLEEKIEYSYQGENISQMIYYGELTRETGALDPYMKISMQYQDNDLKEELISFYDGVSWMDLAKLTYTYSGDKLTQTMMYNNFTGTWEITYKEDVSYSGDNMDLVVQSTYLEGSYFESYKYDFTYENDQLKTIQTYSKEDGITWTADYTDTFTYDSDGNLASTTETEPGTAYKSEFNYEEEKGNIGQFIYRGGGAANMILPMPTRMSEKSFSEIEKYIAKIKE